MILLIVSAALQSGISIAFLKFLGELVQASDFTKSWVIVAVLVFCIITSTFSGLHQLNIAMKYYDQIEVQPIYQVNIMMAWILTGLIVARETQFYTAGELGSIFTAMIICCLGIFFLQQKHLVRKKQTKVNIELSDRLHCNDANTKYEHEENIDSDDLLQSKFNKN